MQLEAEQAIEEMFEGLFEGLEAIEEMDKTLEELENKNDNTTKEK